MNNVDENIISSLFKDDTEFFNFNEIDISKVKKYYYTDDIISKIYTSKLEKYNNVENLDEKIKKFLKQDIMYVWEWEVL
jgi:hypothetical protein